MKIGLFSVLDNKAEAFLPLFEAPNVAFARRMMSQCLASPDHSFAHSPADYDLYQIGEYDNITGLVTADKPDLIANLRLIKNSLEE